MLTLWTELNPLARYGGAGRGDALDELRREMNRLFFDYESGYPAADGAGFPRLSLEDKGEALLLRAEVPGVLDKDLELQVEESTVTLKGERKEQVEEGYSVHRKERANFRFARSFRLPVKVAADNAVAELRNGVLTLTLPKAEVAKPRKVAVRTS